ncbi:DUF736 family protein [Pseudomonas sp. BS3782 TE3695]|uniref:DUF736 family protein n=1 Tax=Pseudomonas sp. BS3782 TE3695 TaxID=3349323 RepID=UPI003D24C06A
MAIPVGDLIGILLCHDISSFLIRSKPASSSDKTPDRDRCRLRRTSKDNRSYHCVKLDDPSFTAPIYANLFESDDATEEGNLCSQTSIDCWAEMPAVAPCHDAVVTEGMRGLARSPAA